MNKHLHIVCLDTPWPPDYGGAIDMMNRIIAFQKEGVLIHLHYFSYNERGTPEILNQYCETVTIYSRKKIKAAFFSSQPYIVASRMNVELIKHLQKDNFPILIEGLHCTGILPQLNLQNRKIVVRMHNEESTYYKELARAEKSFFKKIYFRRESNRIKKYNYLLPKECVYACIAADDVTAFKNEYHLKLVIHLPVFSNWQQVNCKEGLGNYCLYHGNLSVAENEAAAIWLIQNVFSKIEKSLVIAGKNPSTRLQKMVKKTQVRLVSNPTDQELDELIQDAQINILPALTKKSTGIKLKLLHALYLGRHCIVNDSMVKGTGLEPACHIAGNANAFISVMMQLYNQPFTVEAIQLRKKILETRFNNGKNAKLLSAYLW